jgi:hypothetical protein
MPTEIIAALIAALLALGGSAVKKHTDLAKRVDDLSLMVARDYVTKADFQVATERIYAAIDRFEAKLDMHVFGDLAHAERIYK